MKKICLVVSLILIFIITTGATEAISQTFYVDILKGKNKPEWGTKLDKPWKSITYAIEQTNQIEPHNEVTFIVAAGTYPESITITRSKTALIGTDDSTIINGEGQNAIVVDGAKQVLLENFNIEDGYRGLSIFSGASVKINNLNFHDNSNRNIFVWGNSILTITDCSAQNGGGDGIRVGANSTIYGYGTISSNGNVGTGFSVGGSSVFILRDAEVTVNNNGDRGIRIRGRSDCTIQDSKISAEFNGNDGIFINQGSDLDILNSEILIQGNIDDGLQIDHTSSMSTDNTVITVKNNTDSGVLVTGVSDLIIYNNSSLLIEGNSEGLLLNNIANFLLGTNCYLDVVSNEHNVIAQYNSNAEMRGSVNIKFSNIGAGISALGSSNLILKQVVNITENHQTGISVTGSSKLTADSISVENNGGVGIIADDGSSINISNSTITGNAGGDIALTFNSMATLNGNTIGDTPISCDTSASSRGDTPIHLCP